MLYTDLKIIVIKNIVIIMSSKVEDGEFHEEWNLYENFKAHCGTENDNIDNK